MIAGDIVLILKHSLRNYNFNIHLLNLFIGRTLHDEHMIREQPSEVSSPMDQTRVLRLSV